MYQYDRRMARVSGIKGKRASEIASSIEEAVRVGRLQPGERLPAVRDLASTLGVSPATVSSAYRVLQNRALIISRGRKGTLISERPPLAMPPPASVPEGVRNLAHGNPDPDLLPPLDPVLRRIDIGPRLYGEAVNDPSLIEAARALFESEGISGEHITVVAGALEGIELALESHPRLRYGDKIAVEDPCFPGVLDLLGALRLVTEPVRIDDMGALPTDVDKALRAGARALIITPRAQSPTGAALEDRRVRELRRLLREHPEVLLIEDDHAGPVAGHEALTLVTPESSQWVVIRSANKSLGPDLRLGLLAGDAASVARIEGRRLLGPGWVSHIQQRIVASLLSDRGTQRLLRKAADTYAARRGAMLGALADRGVRAHGKTGLNVWVPVADEQRSVQMLMEAGYAVRAGERFRIATPPGIRMTISTVSPDEADAIAGVVAGSLRPERGARPA